MTELAPGAITTADIYRELVEVKVKLAVIEQQNAVAENARNDHETRLRAVERFRWVLFGGASVVASAAGIVAALVTAKGHA